MTTPTKPQRRSKAVRLAAVPLIAAAFIAGCGDDDEETAYCVNADNEVVDDDNCDRGGVGGVGFFIIYGGLLRGPARPGSVVTGGDRVDSRNRGAVARRGGFGGSSRAGGVGRSVGGGGGGFGSSAGS